MEAKSVVCFSFSLAAGEPMAYIRLIAPLRTLGIRILNGFQENCDLSEMISQGDIVIFQREFPMQFDVYQQVVEIAREKGKPIVLELDDLLFFLPDNHPDRQKHYYAFALSPMLQALMEVDAVIVPTVKMREALSPYNNNEIFVAPNYFDDSLWSFRPPTAHPPPSGQIVIGYMGTNSHQPDLEFVAPLLMRLLDRLENLRFRVWGIRPPVPLRAHPQVEWIPCEYHSYEDFAAFFQTQSADIFIAPLIDNLFNQCKSPLKFFEYSALGVPGVYSRLEPYEQIVQSGQNGMLAESLDEWEWCLTCLIEDHQLRFRLADGAQATIKRKWLLSKNAYRWQKVFQKILSNGRKGGRVPEPLMLKMLRSINAQCFEAVRNLKTRIDQQAQTIDQQAQTIDQQAQTIDQQAQTIQELNQEILGYVLSRSWRFTRPLRVISRTLSERYRANVAKRSD